MTYHHHDCERARCTFTLREAHGRAVVRHRERVRAKLAHRRPRLRFTATSR